MWNWSPQVMHGLIYIDMVLIYANLPKIVELMS